MALMQCQCASCFIINQLAQILKYFILYHLFIDIDLKVLHFISILLAQISMHSILYYPSTCIDDKVCYPLSFMYLHRSHNTSCSLIRPPTQISKNSSTIYHPSTCTDLKGTLSSIIHPLAQISKYFILYHLFTYINLKVLYSLLLSICLHRS